MQTAAGRLKTEDFRVIQGVGAVREDLLVLVRRGSDDRVVSDRLRKISRADRARSHGRVCNERTGVEVVDEFWVVNSVDAAIGEGCWWGRWVGMDIYAGKHWIVI